MKKNSISVAVILSLLLSMVTGLLIVKDAKANPFFIFEAADPIPGTIPPIITVSDPQNNTVYQSNTVSLSFSVTKPEPPLPLDAGINSVRYTLDGNRTGLYYCTHYSSDSPPGLPSFSCSKNLTLPEGKHTLVIETSGVVLPGNLTIYGMSSYSIIIFTVDTAINLEQNIPEFPSWTIMFPVLGAPSIVVVVCKLRLNRNRKNEKRERLT
jgi:hypothetical protein